MAHGNILGLVALCVVIIFAVSLIDTMPWFRRMREPFIDPNEAAGTGSNNTAGTGSNNTAAPATKNTSTASEQFGTSEIMGIIFGTIGGGILLLAFIFGRSKPNPYLRQP